jgi:hypothetical protein
LSQSEPNWVGMFIGNLCFVVIYIKQLIDRQWSDGKISFYELVNYKLFIDQIKKKIFKEPSYEHSYLVWFQLARWFQKRWLNTFYTLWVSFFFCILLTIQWTFIYSLALIISQTVQECSLDGPLQTLGFLFRYEIPNGSYGRT